MKRRIQSPQRVVLGIESSTSHGGAALATPEGELISHRQFLCATGYSRRLMPTIEGMLDEIGATREALAAIAVTRGPGAFTGVRIGLATAKTLAWSLNVPLYLLSTLECLARRARMVEGTICPILDARRNEIYSGVYQGTALEKVREAQVEPIDDLLEFLATREQDSLLFTGDGAEKYRDQIVARFGSTSGFVEAPWNRPAADVVALEGAKLFNSGEAGVDPMSALPEYLRRSDAVRNLAAKAS